MSSAQRSLWRSLGSWLSSGLADIFIACIRLYQIFISPLLGPKCRFEPSCSRYAIICLSTHGPLRGSWLAVRRISRCHPFHPGGIDPPPPASSEAPPSPSSSSSDRAESSSTPTSR